MSHWSLRSASIQRRTVHLTWGSGDQRSAAAITATVSRIVGVICVYHSRIAAVAIAVAFFADPDTRAWVAVKDTNE